jgi:YD repeat-containing protein
LTSGYQTTENVFGVSTSGGLVSNDIVGAVKHPDTSTGNPSSSEQETYTYNQLGQVLTYTDRNGNVHTYSYDVLGRIIADAITTLGSGEGQRPGVSQLIKTFCLEAATGHRYI